MARREAEARAALRALAGDRVAWWARAAFIGVGRDPRGSRAGKYKAHAFQVPPFSGVGALCGQRAAAVLWSPLRGVTENLCARCKRSIDG